MLTDEQLDAAREAAKRWMSIDSGIARDLLDEIARLLAENDRLKAARLSPETVNFIRHEMFIQWNRPEDADEEVDAVIADLDRCYPPEEE